MDLLRNHVHVGYVDHLSFSLLLCSSTSDFLLATDSVSGWIDVFLVAHTVPESDSLFPEVEITHSSRNQRMTHNQRNQQSLDEAEFPVPFAFQSPFPAQLLLTVSFVHNSPFY